MDDIIRTVDLSKDYGDVKAATALNLNVRKGEIYGFLGLNGAGKTTTIRMLLGMIRPTSGKTFILEEKVHANHNKLWEKIGYMVEIPYSYPNLTVWENLEIIRRLRFLPSQDSVDSIVDKLQLSRYVNRKAKNLSLGNKQRLGLAKAMIHNPEILILDEPANGLDPAGIHDIREMLTDLATNHGATIFISSHILGEISRFATRIGIIHMGKLVKEIDTSQLNSLCQKYLFIETQDPEAAHAILQQNEVKECVLEEDRIKIADENAISHPENIATLLVNAGHPPRLLHVAEEDLESYFLRTIKENGGLS